MFRKSVRTRDHMLRKPVTVRPETDLFDAIAKILEHKISGVTVVNDEHKPVGMLSELDCLQAILSGTYYGEEQGVTPVVECMTSAVESVLESESIIDVAQSMLAHKRRRIPVVDSQGVMTGQVTCRQLLRAIRDMDIPDHKPT
ncbi:MAG: CBS domain-containing protein [Pseudomonadales bacterium]|nr:CBS domain-containing protein [Pseudomonadales bacterium]